MSDAELIMFGLVIFVGSAIPTTFISYYYPLFWFFIGLMAFGLISIMAGMVKHG